MQISRTTIRANGDAYRFLDLVLVGLLLSHHTVCKAARHRLSALLLFWCTEKVRTMAKDVKRFALHREHTPSHSSHKDSQ